jgi:hypothetical protein
MSQSWSHDVHTMADTQCRTVTEFQPNQFMFTGEIESWGFVLAESEHVERIRDVVGFMPYNALYAVYDSGEWEYTFLVEEPNNAI